MKGRNKFRSDEAARIRSLLAAKLRADRDEQKLIRKELRAADFYISDFRRSTEAFGPDEFDQLVRSGLISVG